MRSGHRSSRGGSWRRVGTALLVLALLPGCRRARPPAASPIPAPAAAADLHTVTENYPDGAPRSRQTVRRLPDGTEVPDGVLTRWYPDGTREYEVTFVHGQKEGTATQWHTNGRKWTERHFVAGVVEGTCRTWDDAGRLRGEEHYAAGQPVGLWTVWDEDGAIKSQQDFDRANVPP